MLDYMADDLRNYGRLGTLVELDTVAPRDSDVN